MSLSARVAYNTLIQLIGKTIATILGLATIAIMARYLKEVGFGQYTTVMTFLSFFGILGDFGLTLVTSQMVSRPGADQEKLLNNLFSLRLISAVIFLALAPLSIFFFPYPAVIKLGVVIASWSFFFTALNQILVGWFQKNLTMTVVAAAEVFSRLVLLGGVILTAYYGYGLNGVLTASVAAAVLSFLIHYLYGRRAVKFGWAVDWTVWREIIKKSWPLGLTIFFNMIYLRADALILSLFKSQSEVGLYGAAYKVIDVLTALPFMFAGLILPLLTVAWTQNQPERFNRLLQRSLDAMFILALPLVVGAQFTARPLMRLVAGENFLSAGPILQILILAIGFIFIGCLLAHAVIALNKQKNAIGAYFFTAITALIGYLIFIPLYSYYGAAWVTVYSETAIAALSLYLVVKYGRFRLNLAVFLKALAASLIMGLALYYLTDRLNLLYLIGLAALIYFFGLYLFKGIKLADLKNLLNQD